MKEGRGREGGNVSGEEMREREREEGERDVGCKGSREEE